MGTLRLGGAGRLLAGGIGDARVKHVEQREVKTVFDFRDFVESERGLVELAVGDAIIDDARDEEVESLGSARRLRVRRRGR